MQGPMPPEQYFQNKSSFHDKEGWKKMTSKSQPESEEPKNEWWKEIPGAHADRSARGEYMLREVRKRRNMKIGTGNEEARRHDLTFLLNCTNAAYGKTCYEMVEEIAPDIPREVIEACVDAFKQDFFKG